MIRFKDDIAAAQERVEAWWDNRETDRALIQVTSPRETPVFTVPAPTAADLHAFWTDPTVVIPRILNSLGATYFGGEAFPVLYPVPGRIVSITSRYLGAPNVYVDDNTTWSEPIITDWDDAPDLAWSPDNE